MKFSLLRHLADRSLQVCLRQREAATRFQQGCGCARQISVTLTASGTERRSLLKLSIGKPGRFCSNIYDLSRNVNHLPEFVDSVVNALHLNFNLRLQLVHSHFRRAHFAPRLSNFGFAPPAVEEVVPE